MSWLEEEAQRIRQREIEKQAGKDHQRDTLQLVVEQASAAKETEIELQQRRLKEILDRAQASKLLRDVVTYIRKGDIAFGAGVTHGRDFDQIWYTYGLIVVRDEEEKVNRTERGRHTVVSPTGEGDTDTTSFYDRGTIHRTHTYYSNLLLVSAVHNQSEDFLVVGTNGGKLVRETVEKIADSFLAKVSGSGYVASKEYSVDNQGFTRRYVDNKTAMKWFYSLPSLSEYNLEAISRTRFGELVTPMPVSSDPKANEAQLKTAIAKEALRLK